MPSRTNARTGPRARATPMAPDERREALIAVTRPLLYDHGRAVTTRLIAEAAGVAEGTIFRVFESKDDLIDETVARAFAPVAVLERLAEIDPDLPLRERLIAMTAVLQQRYLAIFQLMRALGLVGPPDHLTSRPEIEQGLAEVHDRLYLLIAADADRFDRTPDQVLHTWRLLTFAASHQEIADGDLLTPVEIVDTILHGVLRRDPEGS